MNGVDDVRAGDRQIAEAEYVRGIEQPVGMLFQPENGGAALRGVAANPLKDAYAVMEAGVEERNVRLREFLQFTVKPDISWVRSHEPSAES